MGTGRVITPACWCCGFLDCTEVAHNRSWTNFNDPQETPTDEEHDHMDTLR